MIMGVPYDAEIEYLESTGTQWIDTGIVPDFDTSFEMDFIPISSSIRFSVCAYCGVAYNSGDTFGFCVNNNTNTNALGLNAYFGSVNNIHVGDNGFNFGDVLSVKFRRGNTNIVLTDKTTNTTYGASIAGSFSSGVRNLYLFNGNTGTTDLTQGSSIKTKSFKLWSGSVLVLDLIPVRVGQVGYMYDRVTRRLFGNAGTGSFVLGHDVATPVMGLRKYPQIGGAA